MEVSAAISTPSSYASQSNQKAGGLSAQATNSQDDSDKTKASEQEQQQQDQKTLQQLRSRDREVRAHEAAHVAAAGKYVSSGPSYTFQKGPDGNTYAIGGEVQLDTSQEADASQQLQKSETIRRAALAPAQPSSQDFSVAASATRSAAQARIEIAVERRNEAEVQRQGLEPANDEESENADVTSAEGGSVNGAGETEQADASAATPAASTAASNANKVVNLYSQQNRAVGVDFSQFA